ncbi:MAG: cbb3-type cytochrome c oxidase subunit 3 [Nitrospirota bacterium]|nr:MAG: cbb3-type cytochrome c oxidase subunit 3 [Nitrospirota bacterium]
MELSQILYFAFTSILAIVFLGIIIYYYTPKRKNKVEEPKYRMLEDDDK